MTVEWDALVHAAVCCASVGNATKSNTQIFGLPLPQHTHTQHKVLLHKAESEDPNEYEEYYRNSECNTGTTPTEAR